MDMTYNHSMTQGLPDPTTDAEFYEGVPARRLIAWIIDAVIIVALAVCSQICNAWYDGYGN